MAKCGEHPEEEAAYMCESCCKNYCVLCVSELGYDTIFCPKCELLVADLIDFI